jgi:hypothetical protein
MPLFSQRKGLKPATKAIQNESLDTETRNALWSELWAYYSLHNQYEYDLGGKVYRFRQKIAPIARAYWLKYFKQPLDTMPTFDDVIQECKRHFYSGKWYECFDFIEFTVAHLENHASQKMQEFMNNILIQECCAYRFASGQITELTSNEELESINQGIAGSDKEVSDHLEKALRFLSDRKSPDYQNSIKESVSAIEAAARKISGKAGATLSDVLKDANLISALHPALVKMLMSLYGYAGDEGGVRHANKVGGKDITQAEARFVLVLSSAAVSFLTAKKT